MSPVDPRIGTSPSPGGEVPAPRGRARAEADPARQPGPRRSGRAVRAQVITWTLAVLVVAAVLAVTHYETRDPDSLLHARIAADLAREPASRWIAPDWGGHWNGRRGLYREHPAGIFLLPVLLARVGYPAAQAPYLVNALFQVLTILLIQQIALVFVHADEARALGWLLQLLPIAFTYRIRANHEQVVLACFLLALLATERSRRRPAWSLVTAVAVVATLLVKGVFAVMLPAGCALWLLVRPPAASRHRRAAWAGLALAVAAALGVAAWYEHAYRAVTGESFVAYYLGQQLGLAAAPRTGAAPVVLQKVRNLGWYLGRVAWFGFPWTLVLPVAGARAWWTRARTGTRAAGKTAAPGRGGPSPAAGDAGPVGNETASGAGALERQGLWLFLGVTAFYLLLFSLFDRRTDRYIFPAYFFAGGCGAAVAVRRSARLQHFVAQVHRLYPYEQVLVFLATFALALPSAIWRRFPRFKIIRA